MTVTAGSLAADGGDQRLTVTVGGVARASWLPPRGRLANHTFSWFQKTGGADVVRLTNGSPLLPNGTVGVSNKTVLVGALFLARDPGLLPGGDFEGTGVVTDDVAAVAGASSANASAVRPISVLVVGKRRRNGP
eukprot:1195301-Prorocentrum_minimum.AAC.2